MTEYFAECRCGKVFDELHDSWGLIKVRLVALGLKLNGTVVQKIPIPDDALGAIQYKLAMMTMSGVTTTTCHCIGYVDKDGKEIVEVFDFESGKPSVLPIERLNLVAHTIRFP
jgi:hypothetical protein